MTNREFVGNWLLNTAKTEYKDDIALVVAHSTLRIDPSVNAVSYFVPITAKGKNFAKTFILNGEGFDIWGIEWDRLERFADLQEYNITVLADAKLLYARTPEDAERFAELQQRLRRNLADPVKMRAKALEALQKAREIYFSMLFSDGGDVKMCAGYVLDYLARSVAFANLTYFTFSQTDQLRELSQMEHVPDGFGELYEKILREKDGEVQKQLCGTLIRMVQNFHAPYAKPEAKEHNFQDLADWYGELSYTWLRIRTYTARGDVTRSYMWGSMLQHELNTVCEDFGLAKMALMDAFDAENLSALASRADELESRMRQIITESGGIIHEYTFEDFPYEV